MSSSSSTVLVTGASGFVAGVLIDRLVSAGYIVKGTLRSINDKVKLESFYQHFQSAIDSKKLLLHEADLLKDGSFDQVVKGVDYVFHTASPFTFNFSDPQRQLIDPAVNGTTNVLKSAFAEPSVKKIIVTSSFAAVRGLGKNGVYDENDWNDTANIEKTPYPLSKVLAEKTAWKLFEEHKAAGGKKELIVINPSWIFGPPAHKRSALESESMTRLLAMIEGKYKENGALPLQVCTIDVRDVVEAHVRAAENPNAHGRYLVVSDESSNPLVWAEMLSTLYPSVKDRLPTTLSGPLPDSYRGSSAKVEKELGVKPRPLEETLKTTIERFIELGVLKL